MKKTIILAAGSMAALISAAHADIVQPDDVIVQGRLAAGFGAVNGETFGTETIRLKNNNTKMLFFDTSTTGGSFPFNDWQITANDSSSGGKNKFSIEDIDNARTPFTIEALAPSNSLYVDSSGRVGIGTNTPNVNLHTVTGNTPTLRLEQDASSAFTPQTWDVAGNEISFFIRDLTGGSRLPFRIRPGAPSSSIDIAADGNIGSGTSTPGADLHISRNNGGTALRLSNTIPTTGSEWQMEVLNNGALEFRKIGQAARYRLDGDGGLRVFKFIGGVATALMHLDNLGNLTTRGTVNGSSDVGRKENFGSIDPSEILEKVASLPVKTWSYKGESVTHVGPMAQDFHKAFELGAGEKTISMADADGIAFASIQALHRESREKDMKISELKGANSRLEQRLERLEKLMESNQ